QTAQVALDKIQTLALADYQPAFLTNIAANDWQTISLNNVSYRYQGINHNTQETVTENKSLTDDILKNVNLTLKRGEVVFLIGSNGSGKSTLAKIITGIFIPTTGAVK
ncbi:ATP-binding cassette domain-containing protein, partial [Psychrobacter sp. FME5]|uniref:ATP-binding cassette domain-containing protein n=1 Tax=Psychrobacter sp. FME5 TaxID=2487706 RepID=UPI001787EE09